jgi:hypothetical protein
MIPVVLATLAVLVENDRAKGAVGNGSLPLVRCVRDFSATHATVQRKQRRQGRRQQCAGNAGNYIKPAVISFFLRRFGVQ